MPSSPSCHPAFVDRGKWACHARRRFEHRRSGEREIQEMEAREGTPFEPHVLLSPMWLVFPFFAQPHNVNALLFLPFFVRRSGPVVVRGRQIEETKSPIIKRNHVGTIGLLTGRIGIFNVFFPSLLNVCVASQSCAVCSQCDCLATANATYCVESDPRQVSFPHFFIASNC